MGDSNKGVVTDDVDVKKKNSASLDEALTEAGFGWVNLKYCFALALCLMAPILEAGGYGFVVPAAACDLNMSDTQRGLIFSIPPVGVVLMLFQWGYLVDTQGRRKVLLCSCLGAGVFSIASAFMPNLLSFAICKFLAALCMGSTMIVPISYVAEILPKEYRDLAVTIFTTVQLLGSGSVPLIAWGILSLEFSVDFGAYFFRPWRLLVIVNAMFFLITSAFLFFVPESPKYFVAVGKNHEALKVVRGIYIKNKKKRPEDFPIKDLDENFDSKKESFLTSLKAQSVPLFKPPNLKWLLLNAFLLFGVYSVLSGLYSWIPDILNRLLIDEGEGQTACDAFQSISQAVDDDGDGVCIDTIDPTTFIITSAANFSSFVIANLIGSTVKFINKKIVLILVLIGVGTICIVLTLITDVILFAVSLPFIQSINLVVGLVTAFSVDIFPVNLRGMAVCLTMVGSALGTVFAANISAYLLNAACNVTFYLLGGLLIFCGFLALLLPTSKQDVKT